MTAGTLAEKEDILPSRLIAIFVVISAAIIAAGYFTYNDYKNHYRTEVERELTTIADLKMAHIVRWRSELIKDAEIISRNVLFSTMARRYLENPQDNEAKRQLRAWLAHYLKGYDYDQVRLLDTRGVSRMSSPPGRPLLSDAVKRQLAEVLETGRIEIVDFYQNEHDRRIYLSVLIPLRNLPAATRNIGILSLRIDPEKYLDPFILRWPTPSRTAETLLVRRDGNDVLCLVDLRARKDSALKLKIPLTRTDIPMVMAVRGKTGIVQGVDDLGHPVIADIRTVPGSSWFLVTRKNAAEVYDQARRELIMIAGFVAALLLASAAGLALIWRQQTIAVYKEREKGEAAQMLLGAIVESSEDAIISKDLRGTILSWNSGAEKMYGYSAGEVVGKSISLLVPPEINDEVPAILEKLKKGEAIKHYETRRVRKDGRKIFVSVAISPILDASGKIFGASTITRDITERRRMEEERQKTSEEIRDLYNNAPCGYHSLDANGVFIRMNDTELSWLGYSREEILGKKRVTDILSEASVEIFKEHFSRFKQRGWVYDVEIEMVRKDGTIMPAILNSTAVKDAEGNFIMSRSTINDITERKKAEESMMLHAAVFAHTSEGIMITDTAAIIESVNDAFIRITGYNPEEAVGLNPRILKSGLHDDTFYKNFWAVLLEKGRWKGEFWNRRKTGEIYPQETSVNAIRDRNGRVIKYVAIFSDITERKKTEETLLLLSMNDGLTGLLNRRAFDEYLDTEWRRAARNRYPIGLVMIDIDYFKKYNDTYGHLKGDDCLRSVAKALKESLKRPGDMAARYGGEEFICVLPVSDAEHAGQIAEVIRSSVEALGIHHETSEVSDHVTVSIGVASVVPLPNSFPQSLIKEADSALYQAKNKGRNNVRVLA